MTLRSDIEELKRLEAKATPGEWGNVHNVILTEIDGEFPAVASCVQCIDEQTDQGNANFIATARNTLPRLIAQVERMEAALKAIEGTEEENWRDIAREALKGMEGE